MILSLLNLLRTLVGWLDLILLTIPMYLLSFLPNNLLDAWYRRCFRYWCHVFIRALRVKLYIHQKNLYDLPKQFILIANHPSAFEDLGVSALFDVHFLAKIEVKSWWIVGRIAKGAGTFYVHREAKDSREQAARTLSTALKEGKSIGIYPEGGCKGRRVFLPFRHGPFVLSLESGVPILPVFLHYEAQEDFEWQRQHLVHKLWTMLTAKNPRVNYYIYDAINPKQFDDKQEYCEYVQNLYLQWQKKYLE